jgi:predicted dehydrogenase
MCKLLEEKRIAFSYGALRNYMPIYRRALERVSAEEIGKLSSITVKFGRSGLLWDHPHSIALLFLFSGTRDIEHVQATLALDRDSLTSKLVDCDPVVLSATVVFTNGVVGYLVSEGGRSISLGGSNATLSVVGNGSWIVWEDLNAKGDVSSSQERWRFEKDESVTSGRVVALRELRDALLSGRPASFRPEDAFRQHQVLFALVQSHLEGGRRVRLEDVDPDLVVTGSVAGKAA